MKHRIEDIGEIAKGIREKILPDHSIEDWRNNDVHLGVRHWESGHFRDSIMTCFDTISSLVEILTLKEEIKT